ncbi:MAG: tetratricopeptide repeat protein, partial [Polyangiales bacterium]
LYTARKRWPELADHLRDRIEGVVGTGEELELKHRLARLLGERLDDKEGAVDLFEEIVQADPGHRATIERLEQLVLDDDLKLRITQILEPIYRQSDEWKKLVAILEAQVEMATDPMDKVRVLGEIGRLHEERGGDPGLAFRAWSRAFVEEPNNDEVRGEIDRLAAQSGAWDELVRVYEQALSASNDPTVTSDLLGALARVHDERRGDPRTAIETYERLLEHDPDDASPLDALEALHTMVGDWSGMVDVLQRRVERAFDPEERGELLRRAGSVQEELLGDTHGAIESYRRASEEDDRDEIALEALDRLYVQTGRHEDLGDILRRRIDVAEEPADRVELGLRLGELCESQLGRPEDAIEALQRVLDDEPSQPDAVASLSRLYERQGMYPELLDNLKLQAGMAERDEDRIAVQYRIGEVLERQLDDVQEAMVAYQQALEIDQRHEPSVEALLRISKLEDYRVQAAEILEPLLHVQERWDDLAGLVERRAEAATDPLQKRDELRRLAEIHENGRQDRKAAFEAVKQAFAEDPGDVQTADEVERLGGILEAWGEVADAFASRASAALDPQAARALYVRLANIAEERLQEPSRAIEAYARAAEQVGDDEELLEALDRLYAATEGWTELADVIERRIAIANDPSQQNELLARVGQLRAERFDDPRGAFSAYQEVLDRDPSEPTALEAMEKLADHEELALDVVETLDRVYRETGRNDKLADLYDLRINLVETDGERVHLLQEAAQMWEQELGQPDKALDKMRKAFELDPRDAQLLDEVERLAEASGAWESLRGMIENVSGSDDLDRDLRRDLNLRAAGWYRDRLEDAEAAEGRLRAALETDSEMPEAHEQLVSLLRVGGREADLVAALRAWAGVETDEEATKERLREAARLAESALGDAATAGECLAAILESDPSDPE